VSELLDKTVKCDDCGKDFVWRAQEQAFYAEQGYQPPRRCKACRQAKKEQRGGGERKGVRE
jgi:hypothetical protein